MLIENSWLKTLPLVQIMRQPLHPGMMVRSMARLVARVGYATAEMAENWENECSEVLEEEDNVRGKERGRKLLRH